MSDQPTQNNTAEASHVVVIDDSKMKQRFLKAILEKDYTVHTFSSVREAMSQLGAVEPSCFLMDMERPGEDSVASIRTIKDNPKLSEVPIIMITPTSDVETEHRVLECGCDDYVGNRFAREIIRVRVNHLVELFEFRKNLEKRVEQKTQSVMELQDSIMLMLSDLVECRDSFTSGHAQRTRDYMECLVCQLQANQHYVSELHEEFVRDLVRAAPLHDIGKVGIPDAILNKPGKLTSEEFETMKKHTIFGAQAIMHVLDKLHDNAFLRVLRDLAMSHHERWDGTGYPFGLQGESIPLSGRIMAIPDVYDALVSERPYKKPFPHEKAVAIIKEGIGSHFDPFIGQAFLDCELQFRYIAMCQEEKPQSGSSDL